MANGNKDPYGFNNTPASPDISEQPWQENTQRFRPFKNRAEGRGWFGKYGGFGSGQGFYAKRSNVPFMTGRQGSNVNLENFNTRNFDINDPTQIKDFQRLAGLKDDGVFGPKTKEAWDMMVANQRRARGQEQYSFGDDQTMVEDSSLDNVSANTTDYGDGVSEYGYGDEVSDANIPVEESMYRPINETELGAVPVDSPADNTPTWEPLDNVSQIDWNSPDLNRDQILDLYKNPNTSEEDKQYIADMMAQRRSNERRGNMDVRQDVEDYVSGNQGYVPDYLQQFMPLPMQRKIKDSSLWKLAGL